MALRKILLDTSVYLDWVNRGQHERFVLGKDVSRYLSPVVLMELRAGAGTRKAKKWVDSLLRVHAASGRIVEPSTEIHDRAGRVLQRLPSSRRRAIARDVVIAMSARAIDATVVTADRGFKTIRQVEKFALEIV